MIAFSSVQHEFAYACSSEGMILAIVLHARLLCYLLEPHLPARPHGVRGLSASSIHDSIF